MKPMNQMECKVGKVKVLVEYRRENMQMKLLTNMLYKVAKVEYRVMNMQVKWLTNMLWKVAKVKNRGMIKVRVNM